MHKNIRPGVLPVIVCLLAVLPAPLRADHVDGPSHSCRAANSCGGGSSSDGPDYYGLFDALFGLIGRVLSPPESAPSRPDRTAEFNDKANAAVAARQAGNYDEAVKFIREALEIRDNAEWRQWLSETMATAANKDGVKAFNSGDYARAESLFEQALQSSPNDATIAKNLNNARERQSAQREEQARRAATQASLDRLTGVLSNMQPAASTGLAFDQGLASGTATSPAGGLDFLPASGAPQVVSNLGSVSPDIGLGAGANVPPLSRPRDANFGGGTAREQLEAAAVHGVAAVRKPTDEAASDTAMRVFDKPGDRVPPLAVKPPDTPPGRPVAESAAPKPPKVVELERNLEENRAKREKIEREIEGLKNERQTPEKLVEISKKKDELGRAEQERDFFKFQITQAQVDNSGGSAAAPQEQPGSEAR